MKKIKIILIFIAISSGFAIKAQFVVSDPVTEAMLTQDAIVQAEQVANGAQMIITLKNTVTLLEKVEKRLNQVNTALETSIWVKRVYNRQVTMVKMQKEMSENVEGFKKLTIEEIYKFNQNLLFIVMGAETLLRLVSDILTSGIFTMDDKGRLDELKVADNSLAWMQTAMKIQYMSMIILNEERMVKKGLKTFN